MRHVLANIFTYLLIVTLIAGAVVFAWARSAQLVIARETEVEPLAFAEANREREADWLPFGKKTYVANCQNCHTADGSGWGMYPPVQGMAAHLQAEGGREYLIALTLNGLYTGTYGAPMPPMPELSDAEIAAVTNYLLTAFAAEGQSPGASDLYRPEEVANLRGQTYTEWEMGDRRPGMPSARELGKGVRVAKDPGPSAVPEGKDE